MTVETPQPRDRVRVILEGPYVEDDTGRCVELADGETYGIPDVATVEVLERADDPSKDQIGTVRTSQAGVVVAKQFGAIGWAVIWDCGATDLDHYLDEDVARWPVTGVVPGTPAAEAQQEQKIADALPDWERELIEKESAARTSVRVENTPGVPVDMQQRIGELLVRGDLDDAMQIALRYMPRRVANEYLRDLPEWATYNSRYGRTEVDEDEAHRMRAMGFDKQPEFKLSDEDRALIRSVLDERASEYVYGGAHGWKWDSAALTGVVADIVYAAIVQDRKRGDR